MPRWASVVACQQAAAARKRRMTIRNLDEDVKKHRRDCAAERRPTEEDEHSIPAETERDDKSRPRDLAKFTRECFAPFGGVELDLPPRGPMREPPDFS